MIAQTDGHVSRSSRWGWGILLSLSVLLTLNGLALYFFIADSQLMQTVSVMEVGLGLFVMVVSWEGFRRRSRWAWNATWVLVALLAALGLHILLGGEEPGVGLFYLSLSAIALLGQLLAGKSLRS
ncbi:MAG TPA: hypothetical protein VK879_15250 [Candidatus Sulfomarinibacteraceae bacterium]|nr:hypothetical protein [Candidatus Sulfomarinibacteraceae bacterium]